MKTATRVPHGMNRFILVPQTVMRRGLGINPVSSWQSQDWNRTTFPGCGHPSLLPQQTYWAAEGKHFPCAPSTYDSTNKIQLAAAEKSPNITSLPKTLSKIHLFLKLSQKERMPYWPKFVTIQSCSMNCVFTLLSPSHTCFCCEETQ